jgi:ABC-type dipeptide/oligopeptide/nickel transport system ATPase subunit
LGSLPQRGVDIRSGKEYLIYLADSNFYGSIYGLMVFSGSGRSRTMMLMSMIRLGDSAPILCSGRHTSHNEVSVWISMSTSNAIVDAIC